MAKRESYEWTDNYKGHETQMKAEYRRHTPDDPFVLVSKDGYGADYEQDFDHECGAELIRLATEHDTAIELLVRARDAMDNAESNEQVRCEREISQFLKSIGREQ